jgi:hypothetical protein
VQLTARESSRNTSVSIRSREATMPVQLTALGSPGKATSSPDSLELAQAR